MKKNIMLLFIQIGLMFSHITMAYEKNNEDAFAELVKKNSYEILNDNDEFSGSGWEFLLREGKAAQFFLLGEEHGIAENPQLTAALFKNLSPSGYRHLAVEVSPQLASLLEEKASEGLAALKDMFKNAATNTVFFGMLEESVMLTEIVNMTNNKDLTLWGLDYEVLGDQYLIEQLAALDMPKEAEMAFKTLEKKSIEARKRFEESRNPRDIFSFSANPEWVKTVMDAWPNMNKKAAGILHTLHETYAINKLWTEGRSWESNQRRAQLLRHNLLTYWQPFLNSNQKPKVMFKMGSSHMMRGRNLSGVYDLGSLIPEMAEMTGDQAFQLMVLPGQDSQIAAFNPGTMKYAPKTQSKSNFTEEMKPLTDLAIDKNYRLIDLRPLRKMAQSKHSFMTPKLIQTIHGFDAILIMNGSTASSNLLQ